MSMAELERKFSQLEGLFIGTGTNHEGQSFTGTFEGKVAGGGSGLSFSFDAVGDNGIVFHAESSLIGKTFHGKLGLWVVSSNHPAVFERTLREKALDSTDSFTWIFAFGDQADRNSFREEIKIESTSDSIRYVYSWGMPGGDFAERSGALMERM